MKNTCCINCRGNNLEAFIDLGDQPNGNAFPSQDTCSSEILYPCAMLVCTDCWQVQLEEFPSTEEMFTCHPYVTGLNQPVVAHLSQLASDVVSRFDLPENSLVLDIGANDGTLLKSFQALGMRVLGIDPCVQVNDLARENGITVFPVFWNKSTADAMGKLGVHPDVITATAVFYHVDDLHNFIEGVATLLQKHSVFCVQSVYLRDLIEKAQFDHFYHEHIMIHAVEPLRNAFEQHGLRMLDVDFYPVHGGSFVLYVVPEDSPRITSPGIEVAIQRERNSGLNKLTTYHQFTQVVEANKNDLLSLLKALRKAGNTVYGLGAPVKGNTLLNYYGIDKELVDCLVEINLGKVGLLAPGSHIPVIFEESLEGQPDFYLVLAWNYLEFFVEKYAAFLNNGGRFIVPHPEVRIVGSSEHQINS